MGLLVWKLGGAAQTRPNEFVTHNMGFGVHQHYVPVERDPARLDRVLEEFITMIEGDIPASGEQCPHCTYSNGLREIESR
jgi:hypothetical protein